MIKDKILIIEDDQTIIGYLSTTLTLEGYDVYSATNGRSAIQLASSHCPDLILLDLGLPDMDGIQIITSIRSWTATPILVVSARDREDDKAGALDRGADAYLSKPFSPVELLARIRTALRHGRAGRGNDALACSGKYSVGDLVIDYDKHRVFVDGRDANLTPNEFRIAALLGRHAGQVLTYQTILRELWGPSAESGDNKVLRVHMANIRRKVEKNPMEPEYFFTEIGVGYRIADQ